VWFKFDHDVSWGMSIKDGISDPWSVVGQTSLIEEWETVLGRNRTGSARAMSDWNCGIWPGSCKTSGRSFSVIPPEGNQRLKKKDDMMNLDLHPPNEKIHAKSSSCWFPLWWCTQIPKCDRMKMGENPRNWS
jgi:hypothetical protein